MQYPLLLHPPKPSRAIRLIATLLLLWLTVARGRELPMVLSGPAQPVPSAARVSVWLTFLNDSPAEVTRTFPDQLTGRLVAEPRRHQVELPARGGESGEVRVAAGRFARREYALQIPDGWTGRMLLELTAPAGVNPIVIEVTAAGIVASQPGGSAVMRALKEGVTKDAPFDPGTFFKQHISGYEPFYFLAGTESPNAKFQVSIKYQLLNSESWLAGQAPALKGFHFAYSQTSLWDWNGESAPFFDSSYRPELLYLWERVAGGDATDWFRLDLQGGTQHESNGKDGADSRSLNIVYLRPTLTLGRPDSFQVSLSPRAWFYVGDLSDNPDIEDYRGYVDLRVVAGWAKGLQLSAIGRLGDDGDHGSLQLDLTYPMMKLLSGSFSLYLHAQYFTGYGESMLLYNERSDAFRIGFSLYR